MFGLVYLCACCFVLGLVAGGVDFLVYGCYAVLAVDLFACDLVLVGFCCLDLCVWYVCC